MSYSLAKYKSQVHVFVLNGGGLSYPENSVVRIKSFTVIRLEVQLFYHYYMQGF